MLSNIRSNYLNDTIIIKIKSESFFDKREWYELNYIYCAKIYKWLLLLNLLKFDDQSV